MDSVELIHSFYALFGLHERLESQISWLMVFWHYFAIVGNTQVQEMIF